MVTLHGKRQTSRRRFTYSNDYSRVSSTMVLPGTTMTHADPVHPPFFPNEVTPDPLQRRFCCLAIRRHSLKSCIGDMSWSLKRVTQRHFPHPVEMGLDGAADGGMSSLSSGTPRACLYGFRR